MSCCAAGHATPACRPHAGPAGHAHHCKPANPTPRAPWLCFQVVYDEAGVAVGVRSEGETAKAKFVVGDPTYFREKVGFSLLRRIWLLG